MASAYIKEPCHLLEQHRESDGLDTSCTSHAILTAIVTSLHGARIFPLQGVTPKAGVHEEQKEKDQVKPSNVINITALFFDKDSGLLNEIYAARQLSYDEAHRKVRMTSCGLKFGVDHSDFEELFHALS